MRAWSSWFPSGRRIPGVTKANDSFVALRMALASWPEQTTPSKPDSCANFASRTIGKVGSEDSSSSIPTSRRSATFMLVRMVTPMMRGLTSWRIWTMAFAAASIILRPPRQWTFAIQTSSPAAERIAPATVLGMSWNLRSRKMSKPRFRKSSTTAGPAAVNNSIPTLSRQRLGSSFWAKEIAASRLGTSMAMITRLVMTLLQVGEWEC